MSNLTIHFGALVPKLSRQLRSYQLPPAEVKHYQHDADAITRLAVRGLLSETEARHARRRLVTRIATSAKTVQVAQQEAERG